MLSKTLPFLMSVMMLAATACSQGIDDTSKEADSMTLSDKSITADNEYVKVIGRTHQAEDGTRWIAQSAAGIEFNFTGTKAAVTLTGDSNAGAAWGKDNYARYAVYVDGERICDGMMDEPSKTIDICSFDSEKETNVKILKLSECTNSIFGIKNIDVTSVGNPVPADEKKLKIEFIGDSITCGYGVDDEVKENHFKTDTEDATKAYAFKTAQLLDADYSLVSYSGHGIISGYSGDGKIHDDQTVPEVYNKLGKSYTTGGSIRVKDIDWSFDSFVPDIVVINLGTNDDSYTGTDETKQRAYIDGYIAFLEQVRTANPDAQIVCTLGIMGDRLYPAVETAVQEYSEKSGDKKVSSMKFDVQNSADGYAADWHPTEATHTKAAQKLADYLKTLI